MKFYNHHHATEGRDFPKRDKDGYYEEDFFGILNSIELIHKDGSITPGSNLPNPRSGHCIMSYQNSIYLTGILGLLKIF